MEQTDIDNIVKSYISEFFFIDKKELANSTLFDEDISADAFVYSDCIDALEEEFAERGYSFRLGSTERTECETIGELIEAISSMVTTRENI